MRFSFSLRQRRFLFVAVDFRNRSGGSTRCSFCFVLVAHNRGPRLFQFSMGRPFAGDGFFIDLFCAVAAVATGVAIVDTITASD